MSLTVLRGDARFGYTPEGGSPTTHLLAVPLMELQPANVQAKYEWWSESLTTRELITIGSAPVSEVVATIRLDDEPVQLKAMLEEAIFNGVTLTYRETASGTAYPVVLLGDSAAISPDRDMFGDGRWEARIHMRRIDGGNLDFFVP